MEGAKAKTPGRRGVQRLERKEHPNLPRSGLMSIGHPRRPRAHCATLGVRRTSDKVETGFKVWTRNVDALTRKLDLQDFQREAHPGGL